MTQPMTHLTIRAWAYLLGAWPCYQLPTLVYCCDAEYDSIPLGSTIHVSHANDLLPTCPECAMHAENAKLLKEMEDSELTGS